jgi:uncharacterized protein (DUF2249 family)
MVIQAGDRVSDVLARDESLVDVFVAAAPQFERLRNPAMRRVMARLVTVGQAAQVAGVDAAGLVRALNAALAGAPPDPADLAGSAPPSGTVAPAVSAQGGNACSGGCGGSAGAHGHGEAGAGPTLPPAALDLVAPDRIIDLDVRDDLRNGQEPFSRIMAARRELAPDGALRLRAIFEPAPLYGVMAKQGLSHWTDRLAADDWLIWFYPAALDEAAAASAGAGAGAGAAATAGDSPNAASARAALPPAAEPLVLDVRGLEPPEPMQRTLEALATLPPGGVLIQLNVRVPQMLLPQLEARGYRYEVHTEAGDRVRVVIHAPDTSAPVQESGFDEGNVAAS